MQLLSLSNWSLKKTLKHAADPILKAQIIIFYWVFVLNFIKIGAVVPTFITNGQTTGILGCIVALLITIFILKILLSRPVYITHLIHFALCATIFVMWRKMFAHDNSLNLLLIQDVFMICMWSFYGLNSRWGVFYSLVSMVPVFVAFALSDSIIFNLGRPGMSLTGALIVAGLNFIVILLGHYYYRNAIYKTIEEKELLNHELEESNKTKILFLSTMSHELRTPLNSVIGMANLLIEESKNDEQQENLDILKFSAESLLALINDILDFNKMGSGKVKLEAITFNLRELLENACSGLRIKASEKNLYCRLNMDPSLADQYVIGDPTRLLQIVYNLVGNAIKFTKHGGVEVRITLLGRIDDLLSLRFIIQDSGLGISQEQQKYIFEPFIQASKNTTRKFGGTGLGLSIVKHLLALHKSEIHLESEINAGAKFYFDIDYPATSVNPSPVKTSSTLYETSDISDLAILLVEDNMMNILFMKKLFSKWGMSLTIAENGEEAVKLAHENVYDLILMDIHMPIMNGYEATTKIRAFKDQVKANVCIIALTASVSIDVHLSVVEVGMNDSISKPFQPEKLYQRLKELHYNKHFLPVQGLN